MNDYTEYRRQRDAERARYERRHGKIKPTEQFNNPSETHTESVVEEPKRTRDIFLLSEKITVGEREDIKEGESPEFCENLRERGYKGSGIKKTLNRQIWFLLDRGYTYRGIAYELGCDKITVWRHKLIYRRMK